MKIIGATIGTTLPKSNFEQSDPAKGDYIKNRPFYEYVIRDLVLSPIYFYPTDERDINYMGGLTYFEPGTYCVTIWTNSEYWGNYPGTEYEVTLDDGNNGISCYDDNFNLVFNMHLLNDRWKVSFSKNASHYVKIEKLVRQCKQLDEKFIPDTIARVSDISGQTNAIQSDWKQTDETAKDFIKNKPNEEDALALLIEMGFVSPIAAADGSVYVDSNGALYSL